ncbi:hypothetical protein PLEOSDRAFT_1101049 [Pleurotus ostreatus PC15]|uniref:Uncharacterized protein n=1 Tax=Pleurotus ostreatus (strain PC15) TaxID=1137138 RepID=A0A067NPM5_PLEO1|nr:hypothetical protein PLEOSDRAFT_1101049 [Pleurotus ostreatus PC15]
MSYALSLSELVHPETDGSQSNPTAGGAAEAQTILFDPDFSYGLDTEAPLADKDSDERRSWIDGVSLRGEASDESEYNEIYGSGDDYGDDCATSNDVEDTRDTRTSEFAAATDKDQPPSGERVSIEYNATQFMLGGLQKAGNRTAAPCEPRRVTDDQSQSETLGCFTPMEAWARQILLTHDIPECQHDESVLHYIPSSLIMFAETFYDGFVHSTEQLLRESLVRQAQRHSPVLELQDFCFDVDVQLKLTPPFHNITSTRVFRTLRTTSARKLQDLQRKVDFITGKLDRASEKEDVPRQTRNSKVQAIKQNLDEQLLLGRVVKDLATTAKPKDKQKGAVSTPAPARKSKQKDDKATPTPTPDAESISTAPKQKGRLPKISRNAQPIRAISPTSAYRGGKGKNAALLENTLRAPPVMSSAMAPPPPPAPTMLHSEVPSGQVVPQAEEQSTSDPRPANLAGSASASGSLPPIFVPYDYPTPTDSLPPSRDSSVLRMLDGEVAQHAIPPILTALSGLSSPDTLPGTVSDDGITTTPDVDANVTPKAAPRRSGRKVNPTPKAEELMQTRARAKARVEKKAVGSLTKEVGMSTRSLTGKAGPSTPTPQPLVRKRKLGD